MFRRAVAIAVLLCAPAPVFAQSVTLGGSLSVAAADDFATRNFQDPWDMNERTDFGWFLNGSDQPLPQLSNPSFSSGIFSATTQTSPNLFLLDTGNPNAARIGKTGTVYPIDANTYRLVAIRMNINGTPQATLDWNQTNLWDGTDTSSNVFTLSSGWRTYLIDLPTLGTRSGPLSWSGLIRVLRLYPSFQTPFNLQIDWIRLVNVNSSLCRQVTWSGFSGAVDLYLVSGGVETLLATGVSSNSASAGCTGAGSGYNFYAGALAPGTYQVRAKRAGNPDATSGTSYTVNDAPTLTVTSPSDEGSTDDFAATVLGNAWDMNVVSDVEAFFGVSGQPAITTISAETPAGTSLGNVSVLSATSAAVAPPAGDPILQLFATQAATKRIDPAKYRILTVEYGIPNLARSMNLGSVARVVWRVAGDNDSVSDDIILNSRAGANVMDKFSLDMADRVVLPIEEGSQIGWVPGSSALPGIQRFRFDPHEFPGATPFYVRRIKLAALERVAPGANYTFHWTASKSSGTVTLYYDTDRNPSNGKTQIGNAATSAGALVWNAPSLPLGEYHIYAEINDGQNINGTYSRWPLIVGQGPPSSPPNFRIVH